jgi:hypothetical protein
MADNFASYEAWSSAAVARGFAIHRDQDLHTVIWATAATAVLVDEDDDWSSLALGAFDQDLGGVICASIEEFREQVCSEFLGEWVSD